MIYVAAENKTMGHRIRGRLKLCMRCWTLCLYSCVDQSTKKVRVVSDASWTCTLRS